MLSGLMFTDITESEIAQVIYVIECHGANFKHRGNISSTVHINFESEYPLREEIVRDLIENYNDIYNKMC